MQTAAFAVIVLWQLETNKIEAWEPALVAASLSKLRRVSACHPHGIPVTTG